MSESLAGLRRKLDGAAKLEAVVRAMKTLAASSIGQYEAALRALADYQQSVEIGLRTCLPADALPLRDPRSQPAAAVGVIVFGSDQGLVGRFNEVIAQFMLRELAAMPGRKRIWAVGDRVCEYLAAAGLALEHRYALPGSVDGISALVEQLQFESEASHASGECASVVVFNNRPQSVARYQPVSLRLLPLVAPRAERQERARQPAPGFREVLGADNATRSALVREYLFICLYKACAESLASENGSRLVAMQGAQENIEALSAATSRTYYRLRQSSIDAELFDVITGFNLPATASASG